MSRQAQVETLTLLGNEERRCADCLASIRIQLESLKGDALSEAQRRITDDARNRGYDGSSRSGPPFRCLMCISGVALDPVSDVEDG
jgi:hypothetical protein